MIQGKEKDVLKLALELFCSRELVMSSYPRSEPETGKKPFFLEKVIFDTSEREPI